MEADVLIIGGGAAGTVAALLLAKAGKHCIILEKNGLIGRKLQKRCNFLRNVRQSPALPDGFCRLQSKYNRLQEYVSLQSYEFSIQRDKLH